MSGTSWFSRIFQTAPPDEPERSDRVQTDYPGAVLRRYRAEGDLIAEPALVWECRAEPMQGLHAHLLADPFVRFSDVLVVLSSPDFLRATAAEGVPWLERLRRAVQEAYQGLCRRNADFPPDRRLYVRMLRDGSAEVGRQSFGLERGEFLTAVLPQVYAGSSSRSKEQVAIHLHLPAAFQGYRKVGRLYDDQVAFTLGAHWLDTFAHPALEQPALYQISRDPDGSIQHSLREELRDRYQVRVEQQQGVSVLTVLSGENPIAHLVLEAVGKDPTERDFRGETLSRMRLSVGPDELKRRLAAASAASLAVAARKPNSQIDLVTLYSDRAVVTRTRFVKLEAGVHEVSFEGLLPWLTERDLDAEVRSGAAKVLAVRALSAAELDARERSGLLREATALGQSIEEVSARIQGLLKAKAQLAGALMGPGEEGDDVGSVSVVRSRLDHLHRSERELDAAIEREAARAAALDDRLVPILRKLERPLPAGQTAVVELRCQKAGSAEIALHYPVSNARWSPQYVARYFPAVHQLELECHAILSQSSGEAWQEVSLKLSASPDARRSEAPAVAPWILRSGPELAAILDERPDARLTAVFGDEREEATDLLAVPDRTSIDDGAEQRVLLHVQRVGVQRLHRVVARLDPHVYCGVRIAAWEGPALPEGPVSCFIGDTYVGSARLDALAPGQPVRLGMGVERALRAQRVLVDRQRHEDEPEAGQTTYSFHYRVYVTSDATEPATVEIVEQVPALGPGAGEVSLEMATSSLGQLGEVNEREGTISWRAEIAPRGLVMIDTKFSIVLPSSLPTTPLTGQDQA